MTKYDAQMQQLNDINEGQNIGGAMDVFSGGSDRSIGHNSPFFIVWHLHRK